jgi:hypothetical protein
METGSFAVAIVVNYALDGASLMHTGARIAPTGKRSSREEGDNMSNAKLAAFAAVLIMAAGSNASAQSSQLAVKAPPGLTRARLVAWCKDHPNARADCRQVRADTREIRADRKEIRSDRKELRKDIKAGDRKEVKADKKELKSDRKELRQDRKDRRGDVRDARKVARK